MRLGFEGERLTFFVGHDSCVRRHANDAIASLPSWMNSTHIPIGTVAYTASSRCIASAASA